MEEKKYSVHLNCSPRMWKRAEQNKLKASRRKKIIQRIEITEIENILEKNSATKSCLKFDESLARFRESGNY